ncbi:MAG: hypothetical protein NTV51_04545 [Verrucomicrobia bacterium]|nr:hypothetical protein [Verrucomicrobiota bacterium]
MRQNNNHAFVNQLLVCLLVSFGFGGSIGVGLVWMRYQITVTAKAHRANQANLEEVKRRLDATATIVETEQGFEALTKRNNEWQLGLVPATDAQVVRVTEDPVMRLARRRDTNLFNDGFVPVTFRVAQGN